jgi:hypothetical protein
MEADRKEIMQNHFKQSHYHWDLIQIAQKPHLVNRPEEAQMTFLWKVLTPCNHQHGEGGFQ